MKLAQQSEPDTLTVPAGEFKAKCLRLIDEANEKQRKVGVTKRGKLVGHFVPVSPEQKPFRSIFGRSPGINVPSHAEWSKLKSEWAAEWEASNEKLLRNVQKSVQKSGSAKR